jgi:uncharacterized membrane protein (UPF0127 family)
MTHCFIHSKLGFLVALILSVQLGACSVDSPIAADQNHEGHLHADASPGDDPDIIYLRQSTLEIQAAGQTHQFTVEIADSYESRQTGLMYRRSMPSESGMLFVFDEQHQVVMWMKNTYLPLDMLFIDRQGVIRSIAADTVPMTSTRIRSGVQVSAVLEVNAGVAAALGLKPGHRILHPIFGQ